MNPSDLRRRLAAVLRKVEDIPLPGGATGTNELVAIDANSLAIVASTRRRTASQPGSRCPARTASTGA